jgi:type II secretion system protein I
MTAGASCGTHGAGQCGFTLIEVMVALVIVAFGMGAVLAALSSAANNIAALHDKTLAQWVALNLVADTRLNLQMPSTGTTEGDVKAFGNANWHWRQDIVPVPSIPGLLEIVVRVQRTGTSTGSSSSGGGWSVSSGGYGSSSGSSLFKSSSGFGSSSGSGPLGFTTSSSGSGFGFSSSSGSSLGFSSSSGSKLGLSSSSGTLGTVSSITAVTNSGKDQNWLATVIGFRGDAVAASSGEAPDWNGIGGTASSASSSGASGASSSGALLNPGTSPGSAFSSSSGAGIGSSGGF